MNYEQVAQLRSERDEALHRRDVALRQLDAVDIGATAARTEARDLRHQLDKVVGQRDELRREIALQERTSHDLVVLSAQLAEATAAIPCANCAHVGAVHAVNNGLMAGADHTVWLCEDSPACNERTAARPSGTIAASYAVIDNLRKVLDDRETQIANQQAANEALTKTNADLAAENARLRSKLDKHTALTWVPTHVADVVTAARAWFHCGSWECPCDDKGTGTCANRLAGAVVAYEQSKDVPIATWAHVEVMGHRDVYGQVARLEDGMWHVRDLDGGEHYYGPGAIFGIHPRGEERIRANHRYEQEQQDREAEAADAATEVPF